MCLILLAIDRHPDLKLVVAANRDEFFARPTRPAGFWPEAPRLLAGRDLKGGGTWFGITRDGRIALVTNVRNPADHAGTASRGALVRDLLLDREHGPDQALQSRLATLAHYPGFNLIAGTVDRLCYLSNRGAEQTEPLAAGVHGLSNARLDTPWPKVRQGKQALAEALRHPAGEQLEAALFAVLADDRQAPDTELPATGVSLEWERLLSARFIRGDGYGTRCSTLLTVARDGQARFVERSFNGAPGTWHEQRFSWRLESPEACDSAEFRP